MSPRPYRVTERRRLATEETRARIVAAAREVLEDPRAATFSIDAVADRAGVARMTVYYQFKSKGKVLEALFDDVAALANMRQLRSAFTVDEPERGIAILIDVFCRLWQSQRQLVRRLHALGVLDDDVGRAMAERNSWRREAIVELLRRLGRNAGDDDAVDLLAALTSFETYDALAKGRKRDAVASVLKRAAMAVLRAPELASEGTAGHEAAAQPAS